MFDLLKVKSLKWGEGSMQFEDRLKAYQEEFDDFVNDYLECNYLAEIDDLKMFYARLETDLDCLETWIDVKKLRGVVKVYCNWLLNKYKILLDKTQCLLNENIKVN